MSGQITLNKQNGGQLTLEPENNAVNKTISIPDAGLMAADASVGKILQVVDAGSTTQTTFSTDQSFGDIGLSATFTPIGNNSKVIVTGHVGVQCTSDGGSNSNEGAMVRMLINNASVTVSEWKGVANNHKILAFLHDNDHVRNTYINLPYTASATGIFTKGTSYTFKIQAAKWQGDDNLVVNSGGYNVSVLQIIEVAA